MARKRKSKKLRILFSAAALALGSRAPRAQAPEVQAERSAASASAAPAAGTDSAVYVQSAKDFLNELIEISKLSKEKKGSKSNETDVLIKRASGRVDFTAVAKKSLGARWGKTPAKQRNEFLETLQKLLEEVAYPKAQKLAASRDDFKFESIEIKGEPRVKVLGEIEREKRGEMVMDKVEVQLIFDKKTKKVVDAVLEGEMISANLKRQFDAAFKKKSFAQILDQMKGKLAKQDKTNGKSAPAAAKGGAPADKTTAPKGR